MLDTIKKLYHLNRCLIGSDQDKALEWLRKQTSLKNSKIYKISSGEKVFTWTVPHKWDCKGSQLDSVPYPAITGSLPFNGTVSFQELGKHLYYRKDFPTAVPYVMKFYDQKDWGFCLSYEQYKKLNKKHKYKVNINTAWSDGKLKILEITIPGKSLDEFHVLAHVDHPYQANDNLSGVAAALAVYQKLKGTKPNHTLKFLFHSETIGTIAYLAKRQKDWSKIKGAIVLDIVGNKNTFLYQKSFVENSALDFATEYVLKKKLKKYRVAKFQEIMGSEELTYNDPKIGIPGILISTYPYRQYHTHFDRPEIIDEEQLEKAKQLVLEIIKLIDQDFIPRRNYFGPLQRGSVGWFLNSMKENTKLDLFQYQIDGEKTVIQIAGELGFDFELALKFVNDLRKRKLLL